MEQRGGAGNVRKSACKAQSALKVLPIILSKLIRALKAPSSAKAQAYGSKGLQVD
jgi:hypothetical protein